MGGFRGKSDYHYQCLRVNVDLLKVIQIGITLYNEDGETPGARPNGAFPHAWQFNFNFNVDDDMYNESSIESLRQAGINFDLLKRDGIDPKSFAALLIPSGLVCFEEVKWISFHGGYDFGYLTKLLMCRPLPRDEFEFEFFMKKFFPCTYDVKHLMKHAIKLHNNGLMTPGDSSTAELLQKFEQKSGLESIAEALKIKRVGSAHQAGSDSLLTGKVFFSMRDKVFHGEIANEHIGRIWGLGVPDISLPTTTYTNDAPAVDNTPPQSGGQNGNTGTPTTPAASSAGPAQTPQHNTNGSLGPMTPGGPFGHFQMGGTR